MNDQKISISVRSGKHNDLATNPSFLDQNNFNKLVATQILYNAGWVLNPYISQKFFPTEIKSFIPTEKLKVSYLKPHNYGVKISA